MDCYSDFKSVLMEVNFRSTPESTVVKALKYSTPFLNFCLRCANCVKTAVMPRCHFIFKKLFQPLSLLLLEHLLLFSKLLDAKAILFGFGHFFNLTSSKKRKKERKERDARIIFA